MSGSVQEKKSEGARKEESPSLFFSWTFVMPLRSPRSWLIRSRLKVNQVEKEPTFCIHTVPGLWKHNQTTSTPYSSELFKTGILLMWPRWQQADYSLSHCLTHNLCDLPPSHPLSSSSKRLGLAKHTMHNWGGRWLSYVGKTLLHGQLVQLGQLRKEKEKWEGKVISIVWNGFIIRRHSWELNHTV